MAKLSSLPLGLSRPLDLTIDFLNYDRQELQLSQRYVHTTQPCRSIINYGVGFNNSQRHIKQNLRAQTTSDLGRTLEQYGNAGCLSDRLLVILVRITRHLFSSLKKEVVISAQNQMLMVFRIRMFQIRSNAGRWLPTEIAKWRDIIGRCVVDCSRETCRGDH